VSRKKSHIVNMLWGLCKPKKENNNNICRCSMQHASDMRCSVCGGYTTYAVPSSAVVALVPRKGWHGLVPLNRESEM